MTTKWGLVQMVELLVNFADRCLQKEAEALSRLTNYLDIDRDQARSISRGCIGAAHRARSQSLF